MAKKHAPIKKLRELNKFADDFLVAKGIRLPSQASVIETILHTKGAPSLPGIPAYLPTPWAINLTKRILLNVGKEWVLRTKEDKHPELSSNLDAFMRFAMKVIKEEDFKVEEVVFSNGEAIRMGVAQGLDLTQETVGSWLRPLIQKEALGAITWFILDTFAVCLATKGASDVPSFYEWFDDWCDKLKLYWPENLRNIDGKKTIRIQDSPSGGNLPK